MSDYDYEDDYGDGDDDDYNADDYGGYSDDEEDEEKDNDYQSGNGNDSDVSLPTQVENLMFVAEDEKMSQGLYKEAILKFKEAIDLESNLEDKPNTFKAKGFIITCKSKLKQVDGIKSDIQSMLEFSKDRSVSSNETREQIQITLENIQKFGDEKLQIDLYSLILDFFEKNNQPQLMLQTGIKLSNMFLDKEQYKLLENMLNKLKRACLLQDGSENPKRQKELLEIYALEINIAFISNDHKKLNRIYKKIKSSDLSNANSRTNAILQEIQGKKQLEEGNYSEAERTLYESFRNYQAQGDKKGVLMLKYVGVASILADSLIDLYNNNEARVFIGNKTIDSMIKLRTAYNKNNISDFTKILNSYSAHIKDDKTVSVLMDDLLKAISLRKIKGLIGSYRRVTLKYIATELQTTSLKVERYLAELILTKEIKGKINEVKGYFENEDLTVNRKEQQSLISINNWIKGISKL